MKSWQLAELFVYFGKCSQTNLPASLNNIHINYILREKLATCRAICVFWQMFTENNSETPGLTLACKQVDHKWHKKTSDSIPHTPLPLQCTLSPMSPPMYPAPMYPAPMYPVSSPMYPVLMYPVGFPMHPVSSPMYPEVAIDEMLAGPTCNWRQAAGW